MMLIAGQTWRAAVLHSGERSRSLLAVFPPRRAARPGAVAALPTSFRQLDGDRRNCTIVVPSGVTTLGAKVDRSGFPIDVTVIDDKNGEFAQTQLFVRVANGTKALDDEHNDLAQRRPGAA
jgi:hypothetical protein